MKACIEGQFSGITSTGETVEKVKMAILPIYESLKIKNLQTAKDHKMAISRVFRQSRKYCSTVRPAYLKSNFFEIRSHDREKIV